MTDRDRININLEITPQQHKVLSSDKRQVAIFGGVGSGKTTAGSIWSLMRAQETPKNVWGLICANTYGQLLDSTIANFYKHCKSWGVNLHPFEPPKAHKPFDIYIALKGRYVRVLCRSLDNWQTLAGMEVAWAWVDETFLAPKVAYDEVLRRTRDTRIPGQNRILITTTPDDPTDSWMYSLFVDEYEEQAMDVVYAPTSTNLHNLPETYIEDMMRQFTTQMFNRMVRCMWVSLEGLLIYHCFNRNIHVDPTIVHVKERPLRWSHDFNIGVGKPMSSVIAQIIKGKAPDGRERHEVIVLDEIVIESADTQLVIDECRQRYGAPFKRNYIIYGDASGHARDTRSRQTDYTLLMNGGFHIIKAPKVNPAIRDRHNSVNSMLQNAAGDVRLRIHPRCRNLIKGLETVKMKRGAKYQEAETYEQHVTTALGYLICQEFPLRRGAGLAPSVVSRETSLTNAPTHRTDFEAEML